jgi:hypothetical protein
MKFQLLERIWQLLLIWMRLPTQLILSIDVKTSYSKIAFNIFKRWNSKDYPDVNAVDTWEYLKNKYEPVSASPMVKLDKRFRDSSLKRGQDHEVFITWVQEFQKSIHDSYFEKSSWGRIEDRDKPLTVEERSAELSPRFERTNMKSTKNEEIEELEDHALLSGQFQGKYFTDQS